VSNPGELHEFLSGDLGSDVLRSVPADPLRIVGEAAAVVDQEATGAGEFVGLLGNDADGEFFTGQVGAGQLEGFGGVGVFDVHDGETGCLSGWRSAVRGRCPSRRVR
jgi:hypothetical protein